MCAILRYLFLGFLCQSVFANYNIFLQKKDVSQLLGLDAELYYVREGVFNEYASRWVVKVNSKIHSINFSWQSLTRRQVLYNMAVYINETSHPKAQEVLLPPSVNVSLTGSIPRDLSSFRLELPCTGKVSGEVEVILNINVTSARSSQPPIVLNLIRNKICIEGNPAQKLLAHTDKKIEKEDDTASNAASVGIWLLCATLSFILVIGTILGITLWRRKSMKRKRTCSFASSLQPVFIAPNQKEKTNGTTTGTTTLKYSFMQNSYTTPSGTLNTNCEPVTYASVYKFPFQDAPCHHTTSSYSGIYESSCYSDSNSGDKYERKDNSSCCSECKAIYERYSKPSGFQEEIQRLHMDRERVRLTEILQEGKIGKMYKGWVQREHPELDQQVIIKTIKEKVLDEDFRSFFFDCSLLSGLRHQNLLTLVGVSLCENAPPFFIYPDIHGKNLKSHIKQLPLPLKVTDIVAICLQVAKGVTFIHNSGLLHKDVAARNCIINDSLQVRVTDSALAQDFCPEDYEPDNGIFKPIRWMAPEVIANFSSASEASDVWAFGVLIWEVVSKCERPYDLMNWKHIGSMITGGMRLNQPLTCPDELHSLMGSCWDISPSLRPEGHKIIEYLTSFKSSLDDFV